MATLDSSATDKAAYFITPSMWRYSFRHIRLYLWGNGRPLHLQSTADFTADIPALIAEVTDVTVREEEGRGAREQRRQEQEQSEQARRKAHQEQEERDLKALLHKLFVAGAFTVVAIALAVHIARRTSSSRERTRVARLGRQIKDELKVLEKIKKGRGNQ